MNPELVSKTHFTIGVGELERFISRDQIPKEFGGDEDWEYQYVEPSLDEGRKLQDFAGRNAILADRLALAEQFQECTMTWLWTSSLRDWIGAAAANYRRNELIEELRLNYWRLDPYVRAPSHLDRIGVIVGDGVGTVHFPSPPKPAITPSPVTAPLSALVEEKEEDDFDLSYFDEDDESEDSIEVFQAVKMPSLQMVDRAHVRLITV